MAVDSGGPAENGEGTTSYVIGIDIGGTFTDACATDSRGTILATKTPSSPPDYGDGVIQVLEDLAGLLDISTSEMLARTSYICHGTTSSLNALVTGAVAKVGFLTTRGHADSIVVMNLEGRYAGLGPEETQHVVRTNKPAPLVPKARVRELTERIDHKGAVIVALDEANVREAVSELLEEGVEAIAVSLLWSFRNPAHERRVREIIHELAPGLYVGLSSEISPRIREYSRSTTTIMSTQVAPRLRAYLEPLDRRLRDMGFTGALLIMQGSGGTISAEDAGKHAITTVGSVLTGGLVGCVNLGSQLGHGNVISTDMGGTTFLVGMVVDGRPVTASSMTINQHTVSLPMVQIHTIGSGGGAIAWVDGGNNLHVGPRSAGAVPGPACYGLGGTEPTITDADVVLGIVNPDYFLGGRRVLDRGLAEDAVRRVVGDPLGLSVDDAAAAIFAIANAQTADVVRHVVVNNGHDPRDFVLYSYGGAGPVHCANYASELGVREILVPLGQTAATFSAFGLAGSDVVISVEQSAPSNFPPPSERVNTIFRDLEEEVHARLGAQGLTFSSIDLRREIDIRYSLQLAEVATPVKGGELTEADIVGAAEEFEAMYERLYGKGSGFAGAGMQFITYRVYAVGRLTTTPTLPELPSANGTSPRPKGRRQVYLDPRTGWADTDVYDYSGLAAGHRLEGPAVVEASTTTVAIPEGAFGEVDRLGNLIIRFEEGS